MLKLFFLQVCVEGNIASGKSTLLEHFKTNQNVEASVIILNYYIYKSWHHSNRDRFCELFLLSYVWYQRAFSPVLSFIGLFNDWNIHFTYWSFLCIHCLLWKVQVKTWNLLCSTYRLNRYWTRPVYRTPYFSKENTFCPLNWSKRVRY